MLEKYKNYKDIKMPDDMKMSILENMREYKSADGIDIKQQPTIKRRFLICVAIFALFAMACTAAYTAIVSNRVVHYVPLIGFVEMYEDDDFMVYSLPRTVVFGDGSVMAEIVIRTQIAGVSELAVVIRERNSEQRGRLRYEYLKIMTQDYGNFYADAWSSDSFNFTINEFPNINEFTLVFGEYRDHLVDVKLEPSVYNAHIIEDDGIRIALAKLTDNASVFAIDIQENIIDIERLFDICFDEQGINPYGTWRDWEEEGAMIIRDSGTHILRFYNENGEPLNRYGGRSSGRGHQNGSGMIWFSENENTSEERAAKAVIGGTFAERSWGAIFSHIRFRNFSIYTDVDLPIPERDERIEFDGGLVIYDKNGITSTIYVIERIRNRLYITERLEFSGEENEKISNFALGWWCSNGVFCRDGGAGWSRGGDLEIDKKTHRFNIMPNGPNVDYIRLKITGLSYTIIGEWTIYFD